MQIANRIGECGYRYEVDAHERWLGYEVYFLRECLQGMWLISLVKECCQGMKFKTMVRECVQGIRFTPMGRECGYAGKTDMECIMIISYVVNVCGSIQQQQVRTERFFREDTRLLTHPKQKVFISYDVCQGCNALKEYDYSRYL